MADQSPERSQPRGRQGGRAEPTPASPPASSGGLGDGAVPTRPGVGGLQCAVATKWAALVGKDIEPASWGDCVDRLLSSGGEQAIYRGHRRFDWDLQSTLERALQEHAREWDEPRHELMCSMAADPDTERWALGVETELTEHFRRNAVRFDAPDLPESWDVLGWWEVMQHHGAPTRLMDWTRSPFTALWFALDGHGDGDGDMALWVYDRDTAAVNHAQAEAKLRCTEGYELLDLRQRQDRLVRLALEDGNPALIPVVPHQFPRAVAQQSVLTVSPSIGVGRPAHWWIRQKLAARVRLREAWKPEMIAACQSMGLSRPGLYRDLDSLGAYISRCFANRTEMADEL